jgi:hypothetical protein
MSRRIRYGLMAVAVVAVVVFFARGGLKPDLPTFEEMREANRQEMAPVLAKHSAAAKARIETLQAVAKDAQAQPPLKTLQPVAALAALDKDHLLKAGLLLATPDWAGAAGVTPSPLPVESRLDLGAINGAMAIGHSYNTRNRVEDIDEKFGLLTGLRYAALVRTRQYDKPRASVFDGERRFAAGRAVGDVLVYDLETKAKVGGFRFEVVQKDTALVDGKSKTDEVIQRDLEESFGISFNVSLEYELKAFLDGKSGSSAPGAEDRASLESFSRRIDLAVTQAHFAAFVKTVEITDTGGLTVTIYADSPRVIAGKDGVANPDVKAIVQKILGREAVVKVVKQ